MTLALHPAQLPDPGADRNNVESSYRGPYDRSAPSARLRRFRNHERFRGANAPGVQFQRNEGEGRSIDLRCDVARVSVAVERVAVISQ
jgi:hypothetical protein